MDEKKRQELQLHYTEILRSTNRENIDTLIHWLERHDFFVAPASTKYHGNYEGGLLEHSMNVYYCLCEIRKRYPDIKIPDESLAIAALLHDICKQDFYVKDYRNQKVYNANGSKSDAKGRFDWQSVEVYAIDEKFPCGHGEKSVILALQFIKLTIDEIYAIRWHMGGWDSAVKGGDHSISSAWEKCPLAVMLHLADCEASYLIETRNQTGGQ